MDSPQEGDAPAVQELLLEHFRDRRLEVEGKLGRRSGSKDKFSSGVTAEQFAELVARLGAGLPAFGLPASPQPPEVEVTVDRFYQVEPCGETLCKGRARGPAGKGSVLRSSFAFDASGLARAEPFEVLNKTRLSDCHIGRPCADGAVPAECTVDLRVSFSLEIAVPPRLVDGAPLVYERRKHRQTFLAEFFRIQLTHVLIGERETFEVEVELRMDVAAQRIEAAEAPGHEALVITRELVAILRELSKRASEIPVGKKRKRQADTHAVELALLATVEEPEVETEVRRCVSEGKEALNRAKKYLCGLLRHRLPPVDEVALCRIAGRHVARVLQRESRGTAKEPTHNAKLES